MRPSLGWVLPLVTLAMPPSARGEELACEFDEGTGSVATLDQAARGWRWVPTALPVARDPDLGPGAPLWFVRARLADGADEGSLACAATYASQIGSPDEVRWQHLLGLCRSARTAGTP